jgi:hypothetical protein
MKSAVTPAEGPGLVVDLSAGLEVILEASENPVADLKPEGGTDPGR